MLRGISSVWTRARQVLVGGRRRAALTCAVAVGIGGATALSAGASQASLTPVDAPPATLPPLAPSAVRSQVLSNSSGWGYKTVQPNGDVCLTVVNLESVSGTVCAHAAEAAKYGVDDIQVGSGGASSVITILPPVGVTSVHFTLTDGTSATVAPDTNGVVQFADPRLAGAVYVLPSDGSTYTIPMPKLASPPTTPVGGG